MFAHSPRPLEPSPPRQLRIPRQLDFIDGLRALAALYIVIHHALQSAAYQAWWGAPFRYGLEVVIIFFTLSGFCLALPQSTRQQWIIDTRTFYQRRARRILPPYYAAVAIGLLLCLCQALRGSPRDYAGNNISAAMIWSHLFLVHNWIPGLAMTLDGPLWSIAVECQGYLVFPLLILLRNRLRRWVTLGLWLIAVQLAAYVTHNAGYLAMLSFFAIGALGADLAFQPSLRRWVRPAILCSAMATISSYNWHRSLSHDLLALTTSLAMSYVTQSPAGLANRLLSWWPLAFLGTFSYSIYLIHSFVEVCAGNIVSAHCISWSAASPAVRVAFYLSLLPLILFLSYAFHLAFERPFVRRGRSRVEARLIASRGTSPHLARAARLPLHAD